MTSAGGRITAVGICVYVRDGFVFFAVRISHLQTQIIEAREREADVKKNGGRRKRRSLLTLELGFNYEECHFKGSSERDH